MEKLSKVKNPILAPAANATDHAIPEWLIQDLRSDHAGETGAVMIYHGILAVSGNPEVRAFAERHIETEKQHLEVLSQLLHKAHHTRLLPLWKVLGWMTGVLPALFGARAVYATVAAVETFVEAHYQEQIERLGEDGPYAEVRSILVACQQDEISHQQEAASLDKGGRNPILGLWTWMVGTGSAAAVFLARRL